MEVTTAKPGARGFTLLEVMIMFALLAVCAMALVQSGLMSMRTTRLADEVRAASFAARSTMEELQGLGFTGVAAALASNEFTPGRRFGPFPVYLGGSREADANPKIMLEGVGVANATPGEVILITDESSAPLTVGRDLNLPAGPDGVQFSPLAANGIDLNGDGDTADGASLGQTRVRFVIGVVVRWTSFNGVEQRYELWSIVAR